MPHWKQSSRQQIISPNCLVSNSYLKHLTLQWRGVIGHKLKSVPFIKDLVFILFEKKQYDWQHLVLATHRSFCPTKLCDFSSEGILRNNIISFSPFLCAQILQHVHKSLWTTQYKIFLKRINVMFTIEFAYWSVSMVEFWYKFLASLAGILLFSVTSCVLTMKNISRVLCLEALLDLLYDSHSLHSVLLWAIQKLLHKWSWVVWHLLPSFLLSAPNKIISTLIW